MEQINGNDQRSFRKEILSIKSSGMAYYHCLLCLKEVSAQGLRVWVLISLEIVRRSWFDGLETDGDVAPCSFRGTHHASASARR